MPYRHRVIAPLVAATLALALGGCATGPDRAVPAVAGPDCPADPVRVVVSVDQWSDLARSLGGACATVTTVLDDPAVDPHDFEPTTGDAVRFSGAQLVLLNGAGYDTWASQLVATLDPAPLVVDGGRVVGASAGANPHLWYSPSYLGRIAAAVTAALVRLDPGLTGYFDARAGAWRASMRAYDDRIATIRADAAGRAYGATESVFDYLAEAVGLRNATPPGWQNAAANDSDPSPGDVVAFQAALTDRSMDVLIYNTQTDGAAFEQIRRSAVAAGVPVVNVTETVPAGETFLQWQLGQLDALAVALGVGGGGTPTPPSLPTPSTGPVSP